MTTGRQVSKPWREQLRVLHEMVDLWTHAQQQPASPRGSVVTESIYAALSPGTHFTAAIRGNHYNIVYLFTKVWQTDNNNMWHTDILIS